MPRFQVGLSEDKAARMSALLAPTSADARGGRFVPGALAGFAAGALFGAAIGGGWGPYPYYYG